MGPAAFAMGPGCCADHGTGPPCTYTVTVLDGCTGDPVSGATIVFKAGDGTTVCSGTTDVAGAYTCTPAGTAGTVVASHDGCSYTGPIYCNAPLTLWTCHPTIAFQAVDDAGTDISGSDVTYYAAPLSTYATLVSMTGGSACVDYPPPSMCSTAPGTAEFCYFGPVDPSTIMGIGVVGVIVNDLFISFEGLRCNGAGNLYHDGTYWETCSPAAVVTCCANPDFRPIYYRRAVWNVSPNCACDGTFSGDGYIKKKLYATMNGPSQILGTDAGLAVELDWDATSWDGAIDRYVAGGMVYRSACHSNGAGGYCYSIDAFGSPQCVKWTQGDFVPYGSSRMTLAIAKLTFGPCNDGPIQTTLDYRNYWGAGCPDGDTAPFTCPPNPGDTTPTQPSPPGYCWQDFTAFGCHYHYPNCIYPIAVGLVLTTAGAPTCVATLCQPIDLVEDHACNPSLLCCTDTSSPDYGQYALSATVTE